jgi:hypothetical protein
LEKFFPCLSAASWHRAVPGKARRPVPQIPIGPSVPFPVARYPAARGEREEEGMFLQQIGQKEETTRDNGMSALKTMKTASRTLKGGREADGMPGRGRHARD